MLLYQSLNCIFATEALFMQGGLCAEWGGLSQASVLASHFVRPHGQLFAPVGITLLMLGNVSRLSSQLLRLFGVHITCQQSGLEAAAHIHTVCRTCSGCGNPRGQLVAGGC